MRYKLDVLATKLRHRLNDWDNANYTDEELYDCLNMAYVETQMQSRCHIDKKQLSIVEDVHTYSCGNIYEPFAVYVNGKVIRRVHMGDMPVTDVAWDIPTAGIPTHWLSLDGSAIRLFPIPSEQVDSIMVQGYAIAAPMDNINAKPDSVPEGYASVAILERAEAEARKMRINHSANEQLYSILIQNWNSWIARIQKSIRYEGQ